MRLLLSLRLCLLRLAEELEIELADDYDRRGQHDDCCPHLPAQRMSLEHLATDLYDEDRNSHDSYRNTHELAIGE